MCTAFGLDGRFALNDLHTRQLLANRPGDFRDISNTRTPAEEEKARMEEWEKGRNVEREMPAL